jgi:outer membrane murein-binding lipoprotein Lpp
MSSVRRAVLIAAAVFAAAACAPAASSAAERGVTSDLTWGSFSNAELNQASTAMRDLNAKWVRLEISWHATEPTQGSYSSHLASIDSAVTTARGAGAKIVMFVNETPQWESGSSNKNAPPRNTADYTRFLQDMVARYAGKVEAWEIWNEENNQPFWPTGPDPAAYAALLRASYPVVKAADPNAKVLFGGLAGNDYTFLERAYAAQPDLGSFFDGLGSHPYVWSPPGQPGGTTSPENYWRDGNGRISQWAFAGYRELRQTMLNHGDTKPLWFTELGWATYPGGAGVSEQTQADYLTKAYRCMEQDPYVQVATWYEMRNNYWANDALDWEDQLGLMRTDYSKKLAYYAFKNYQSGAGSCSYHDISAPQSGGGTPSAPPAASTASGSYTKPPTSSSTTTTQSSVTIRPSVTVQIRRVGRSATSARARRTTRRFAVRGSVSGVSSGRVRLNFERRVGSRWRTTRTLQAGVSGGRFTNALSLTGSGRWRVRATYTAPSSTSIASALTNFSL